MSRGATPLLLAATAAILVGGGAALSRPSGIDFVDCGPGDADVTSTEAADTVVDCDQ